VMEQVTLADPSQLSEPEYPLHSQAHKMDYQ